MVEINSQRGLSALLGDQDSALLTVAAMFLAGVAAGWGGRSLVAGEMLTEQLWLLPVTLGLLTALYAQATVAETHQE